MCGALLLTLVGLLIAGCPDQTFGAVVRQGFGLCPGNHKPGDYWLLPGCQGAVRCYKGYYTIESCGESHDPKICYKQYNYTLDYPECCLPKLVCVGDKEFDTSSGLD